MDGGEPNRSRRVNATFHSRSQNGNTYLVRTSPSVSRTLRFTRDRCVSSTSPSPRRSIARRTNSSRESRSFVHLSPLLLRPFQEPPRGDGLLAANLRHPLHEMADRVGIFLFIEQVGDLFLVEPEFEGRRELEVAVVRVQEPERRKDVREDEGPGGMQEPGELQCEGVSDRPAATGPGLLQEPLREHVLSARVAPFAGRGLHSGLTAGDELEVVDRRPEVAVAVVSDVLDHPVRHLYALRLRDAPQDGLRARRMNWLELDRPGEAFERRGPPRQSIEVVRDEYDRLRRLPDRVDDRADPP